jgi:hypothetical protein
MNEHYPGIYTYIADCRDNIKNGKARIAGPVERLLFIIGGFLLLIAAIAVWKVRRPTSHRSS